MPLQSSNFNFLKVMPPGSSANKSETANRRTQHQNLFNEGGDNAFTVHDSQENKTVSDKINLEAY